MFPVIEPSLKKRFVHRILPTLLGDNVKAREMQPDGKYQRVFREPDAPLMRGQAGAGGVRM